MSWEDTVQRTLYDPEHEAVRRSVREFIERSVTPRYEDFIARRAIPRDVWLEAGKQGFLGLQVPEEYGGAGPARGYPFTAGLAEGASPGGGAPGSCPGIPPPHLPPHPTPPPT